ncbi:leucine-rich repeats and immunoglobulin-like domains protein 2 isoform X1 [Acropora millepora]|uniref:leucine-rich repeats and immunoglobulin-like domains protein 2 isoform X1 n=1 Tax=Acropora millepora TaxID=45264 RepID=UPI001CF5684C|nr:leucine-rich repeats and immunoglobulin-like domains protein 2 isoform X1 [Acropora millepora]
MRMDVSTTSVPSCIFLAIVVTLASLESSVAQFPWTKEPSSPIIVVEGVNNTDVRLEWDYDAAFRRLIVNIKIVRKGGGSEKQIARKSGEATINPTSLDLVNRNQDGREYEVVEPATLVLKDVNDNEEYEYVISVDYFPTSSSEQVTDSKSVFVEVKVPPKITTNPLNERIEIGTNVTLTCEASGDPLPNITWTREGATTNQLDNVIGPSFHLVAVRLNDSGSYRCTAENGYGTVTVVASVSIICTSQCNTSTVGIRITEGAVWVDALTNQNSAEFSVLANNLTAAISSPYGRPENEDKRPYQISVKEFSRGSVRARVEIEFPSTLPDPLKPLRDAMQSGKLGMFTVDRELVINPTRSPPQSSTGSTQESKIPPDVGGRTSGLSNDIIWAIIGSCIAVVVIVAIIIIVCCVVRKKQSPGGSKGLYTEADGYRMNKQPPSSGLGTASPAYVEARMYAPPKNQDDQSYPYEKSGKLAPPQYDEYEGSTPEKRPPPAGGQQGGGGFELWC